MLASNPPSVDTSAVSADYSTIDRFMFLPLHSVFICHLHEIYVVCLTSSFLIIGRSCESKMCTPRKDVLRELNSEARNLKVVLTPLKLRRSLVVPSAMDKVLSQCAQAEVCSFGDILSTQ